MVALGKSKIEKANLVSTIADHNVNKRTHTKLVKLEDFAYNEKNLNQMIENVLRTYLAGDSSGYSRYTKPYNNRIDSLRMP